MLVAAANTPSLASDAREPSPLGSIALARAEFWQHDHLGSVSAITDHTGAVLQRLAYDPFGKRRNTNGSYDEFGTIVMDWSAQSGTTDRGFTGHEHLDDIGLVHMNGRIFNPTLATFMQADPFVQDPGNLQNYNRYAYCFNNPLGCTDPSGFLSFRNEFDLIRNIPGQRSIDRWMVRHPWAIAIVQIVATVYGGPAGAAMVAGYASYVQTDGDVNAARRASAVTYITAQAFTAVGDATMADAAYTDIAGNNVAANGMSTGQVAANIAGHALVGCASAEASGGKCGQGALAAGFGAAAGFVPGIDNVLAKGVWVTAVGGIAAELGGGSFRDGAQSALMGYVFNCLAHQACAGRIPKDGDGYLETRWVDGKPYIVRLNGLCATTDCLVFGANVDWADARSQAYRKRQASKCSRFCRMLRRLLC